MRARLDVDAQLHDANVAISAPTDMRKSYDGLSAMVKQIMKDDPFSEHPDSRVDELTPRNWKRLFVDNPMRSDLQLAQD